VAPVLRILVSLLKLATLAALAILVVVGTARLVTLATEAARPDDAGAPVRITVADGEDEAALAQRLADEGLIQSPMIFQGQLRFGGGALEPGTYTLRKGMSAQQIIDRITGEAPAEEPAAAQAPDAGASFSITIPEGWRIEQIAEEYEAQGGVGGFDAFMQAVADVDRSQYDFLASVPPDLPLEGYLFPDTYTFSTTDPALNVATMLTNFGNKFDPEMRTRTEQMGLSIHQVVTFASLVEREAQVPDERPIIADVYLSRYEQKWRLDADPTVQYVLGRRGDWWPKLTGDDLFVQSPFNMYQNDGIPPGPICNPGFASLQAVLFPEPTDYMYFVAMNDGSGRHAFAATKEEQDANVELYLNGQGASE
jgi:UPF0755 protein